MSAKALIVFRLLMVGLLLMNTNASPMWGVGENSMGGGMMGWGGSLLIGQNSSTLHTNTNSNSKTLHDTLIMDSQGRPAFSLGKHHWTKCWRALMSKYKYERLDRNTTFSAVFKARSKSSQYYDQDKKILRAQILGIQKGLELHCLEDNACPQTTEEDTRATQWMLPNSVVANQLLNTLQSNSWVKLYDWTVCDAIPQLHRSGMTENFNFMMKREFHRMQRHYGISPRLITLYQLEEQVEPGITLNEYINSKRFRRLVMEDQSGRKGIRFLKRVLTQVFTSIHEVQLAFNFTSYNLHPDHVLVQYLSNNSNLTYQAGSFKFSYLSSGWTTKMINLGWSSITHPSNITVNNMYYETYSGFHPTYDARLFSTYLLHDIDVSMLYFIRRGISKQDWTDFANMMKFAIGDRIVEYFAKVGGAGDATETWIFEFVKGIRADKNPRGVLDLFILGESRNYPDFMERLLSYRFFSEFRVVN